MSKHELDSMNNHIIHKLVSIICTCNNKRNEIAYLQFGIQELEGYIHGLNNQSQQQEGIENEAYI